jgi:hypothetical protein
MQDHRIEIPQRKSPPKQEEGFYKGLVEKENNNLSCSANLGELSAQLNQVQVLANDDVVCLNRAEKSYGDSWKKRGGVGAFMMLARKWDRLELQVNQSGYDVFKAFENDTRAEGILDDIRDLRRYLLLVESEIHQRKAKS